MESTSELESGESDSQVPLGKKRKWGVLNDEKYQRNVIKKARVSGKAYVNYKGNEVAEKVAGDTCG